MTLLARRYALSRCWTTVANSCLNMLLCCPVLLLCCWYTGEQSMGHIINRRSGHEQHWTHCYGTQTTQLAAPSQTQNYNACA